VVSIALMNEMPDEGLTTASAAAPATPAAPAASVPKADSKATKFPLDKIAFAEQRPDDVEFPEPNNARENALLNSIIEHFMGGEIRLTEADCSMIQDFLKRKIYSDVFMEPTVRTVYRGMTVGEDFIKKLGVLSSYLSIKPGKIAAITSPRTVDPLPNAYATSWSTAELGSPDDSQSVVWNFATGETSYGRQGGNIGVVLCADVSANRLKFFDAQPLYGLDGMPGVEDEMEAVGMGPIVCRKIYIMKPS
jgi:hypothetical protein